MLELKSVSWQNFMSYGDYKTSLSLANAGQCLITGEVVDEDSPDKAEHIIKKSNGAGKSTIPSAIQWCLFGRTMHSANPGSKVVNYFTGKDCQVTVEFKNGDTITRTRNTNGCNELLYMKNGEEQSFVLDTLSTTKNQQAKLNKEFGLDWDIFCGSVFFNQYGKPWMEMAEQSRKSAIERILHINKFTYYAKAAKDVVDKLHSDLDKVSAKKESLSRQISIYQQQRIGFEEASAGFTENQISRKEELKKLIQIEQETIDTIELPDLEKLASRWAIVAKIEAMLEDLRRQSNKLASKISESEGQISSVQTTIQNWEAKSGKICTRCEQEIKQSHTSSKIDPLTNRLEQLTSDHQVLVNDKSKIDSTLSKVTKSLQDKKPDMTMYGAKEVHSRVQTHKNSIKRFEKELSGIDDEIEPNQLAIQRLDENISLADKEIAKLQKQSEELSTMLSYYNYIHKVYHDRTKLKSFVYQDHLPYINSRLNHYLEIFGLDIRIEITNSLSISSNMWGYDFESGGERKRTDVAFMLAMFDFHEAMYGRQCNVLVLDEVDGRMDEEGIDALIGIIKEDLSTKIETILIISHRNMMHDTFPNEIRVCRDNRFSYIK
jgi:DNA repair exonuclease SbcCD ATPase subunit